MKSVKTFHSINKRSTSTPIGSRIRSSTAATPSTNYANRILSRTPLTSSLNQRKTSITTPSVSKIIESETPSTNGRRGSFESTTKLTSTTRTSASFSIKSQISKPDSHTIPKTEPLTTRTKNIEVTEENTQTPTHKRSKSPITSAKKKNEKPEESSDSDNELEV